MHVRQRLALGLWMILALAHGEANNSALPQFLVAFHTVESPADREAL